MALALATACAMNTMPPPSELSRRANLTVTGSALRIEVRALVGPYVGQVEAAADDAIRRCGDDPSVVPSVVIQALEWKLNAVALGQNALLQPDPVVALIDGWAYAVQMRDFLGGERGRLALGACHDDAAAAMGRIAHEELRLVTRFAPETAGRVEERVEAWAAEHPLSSLSAPRATAAEVLASASARNDLGALAAIGSIVETLDDLTARIAAYRETLLKEARWTGELEVARAGTRALAAQISADADRVALAAERMGELMATIPALVERERRAAMADIDAQRTDTLRAIDGQRVDTLQALQVEADAVMARVDATTRMAIEDVAGRADHAIDRVALRVAQLGLGLAAIVTVAVLLVARLLGVRLHRPRHA
jgi:hypothetical protein